MEATRAPGISMTGPWTEQTLPRPLIEEEMAQIERLRDVLSAGGKNLTHEEAPMKAAEDRIEKRDPMRKAARAARRRDSAARPKNPNDFRKLLRFVQGAAERMPTRHGLQQSTTDKPIGSPSLGSVLPDFNSLAGKVN